MENTSNHGRDAGMRAKPYIPFSTFTTLLQGLKDNVVPNRLDHSALSNFSGSMRGQLMSGLRALDLVDDHSAPTPRLRKLVEAYGTDNWQSELRKLLEEHYDFVIERGLASTTPSEVDEAFRDAFPNSKPDVLRKCQAFFIKAALATGMEISPLLLKKTRMRYAPNRTKKLSEMRKQTAQKKKPQKAGNSEEQTPPPQSIPQDYEALIGMMDMKKMNDDEREAVWTLLQYLKRLEQDEDEE